MSYSEDPLLPTARLRTMQIVAGAMILGVAMTLAILAIIRSMGNGPPPPQVPIFTYVGVGLAFVGVIAHFIVPRSISPAQQLADGKISWLAIYQTRMIVGMALLEGPALYQGIAYFIEGEALALGLGGLLLLGMILQFPTRGRVQQWLESREEQDDRS